MKTIKILLLSIFIISCSADRVEDDCRCNKEVFTFEQRTTIGEGGLPVLTFERVTLSNEEVACQAEQEQVSQGDNTYFTITCD